MNMLTEEESRIGVNTVQNEILYDQNNNAAASQVYQNNRAKRLQEYADECFEMPECAEKLILELICRCESPSSDSMEDVNTILTNIKNRLEVEGLLSKQVQNLLSGVTSNISANLIVEKLEQLIACIRDIDIHRLKSLTTRNNDAIEVIRNKDVYLFIGLTGHGKSTTIHYLAGSQFEELRDSVNGEVAMFGPGRPHYVPVSCPNGLERVTTSPYPESDTNNIIPVVVNLPDGREVILCDAPGFEDTNGVEIDIANSIVIENAISVCKGVKPIIVISKNMGERMTGLQQLFRMLSRMFKISEIVTHFTYVFTNYTQEEANLIKCSISDLIKTELFKNSTDTGYTTLINHIKKESIHPIIIDLNNPTNRDDVIERAIDPLLIQNPRQFFILSLGMRSQKTLTDQIDKHTKAIRNALARGDKNVVVYKMGELMYLRELSKEMDMFERKFEDIKSIFTEYFDNRVFEMWPNDHRLTNLDLNKFCSALREYQESEELKRMIFGDDKSLETLKECFFGFVNQMAFMNDSDLLQTKVANLKLLSSYFATSPFRNEFFDHIKTNYDKACEHLRAILDEKVKSCQEALELDLPKNIGKNLIALFSFYELFKDNLIEGETNITTDPVYKSPNQTPYTTIKNAIKDSVTNKFEEFRDLLVRVDQNSFLKLDSHQKYIRYLLSEIRSYEFFKTQDPELIESIQQSHHEMLENVKQMFEAFQIDINEQVNLQDKYQQLILLRKNDEIARATDALFLTIKHNIECELIRAQGKINIKLRLSPDGTSEIETDEIVSSIKILRRLQWVDNFMENKPCETGLNEIETNVTRNIEYIKDSLVNIDLSQYAYQGFNLDEKLQKAFLLKQRLLGFRGLGRVFPNLPELINKTVEEFEKKFIDAFHTVSEMFTGLDMENQITDFRKAEAALNLLNKTANYKENFSSQLEQDHLKTKNDLYQHLKHRHDWIDRKLDKEFLVLESNIDESSVERSSREINTLMKQIKTTPETICLQDNSDFRTLYSKFKQRLEDFFQDVRQNMEHSRIISENQPTFFQRELRKVKSLYILNEFLDRDSTETNFRSLFHQYNRSALEQTRRLFDESSNLLGDHLSFEKLADNMSSFGASTDESALFYFDMLKKKINAWLSNTVEKLTSLSSSLCFDLEPSDLRTIKTHLDAMKEAEKHLSEFIDNATLLREATGNVKENMCRTVNEYLERLDYFLNSFDVEQFSSKLRNLVNQRNLLNELCGPNQMICTKLETLYRNQNHVLRDAVVRRYQGCGLEHFSTNPPNVILNKLVNINNQAEYTELKTQILEKYRKELEAASNCEDFRNNNHFRKCLQSKIYVSELEEDINRLIAEYENNYSQKIINLEEKLDKLYRGNRLNQITQLYHSSASQPLEKYQIKRFVENSYSSTKEEIRKALDEWNSNEVLRKSQLIINLKKGFPDIFPDQNISNDIDEFFTQNAKFFIEQLDQNVDVDMVPKLIKIYDMLRELSTIQVDSFKIIMAQMNNRVFEYMECSKKTFDAGFKEEDFRKLKHAMILAQAIDSIWSRHERSNELMSYEQMKNKLMTLIDPENNDLRGMEGNFILVRDANLLERDYDTHFERLKKQQKISNQLAMHFRDLCPAVRSGEMDQYLNEHQLHQKMTETFELANQILNKILSGNNTNLDLRDFNIYVYNLRSYEKIMRRRVVCDQMPIFEHFCDQILRNIHTITKQVNLNSVEKASECFIRIKNLSSSLIFKAKIDQELEDIMQTHIKSIGFKKFCQLAVKLWESNEGRMIVQEHRCFESYQRSVLKEKTIRQDINYVLDATRGDSLDKEILREKYTEFNQLYERLVIDHLSENNWQDKMDQLTIRTIQFAQSINMSDAKENIHWDTNLKAKIPKLLAHMFALWTIMNSRGFFETTECDAMSYLFKPHPAQVISVFRMLGVGFTGESKKLDSNLVQLGTGEGKSITLGTTCALLALLGFDVQCVCYSQYLSDRDFNAFKPLFEMLRVEQFIHYGTFKKICEIFINKRGDVRKIVETFLKQGDLATPQKNTSKTRPKMLLIDEVDVFFSKDFYGSSYTPVATLKSPAIEALVREIWAKRKTASFDTVKLFDSYQKCSDEFTEWRKPLLDQFVKSMISSLNDYEHHTYIVKDDKIGYTKHDQIDFNTVNDYKTMFAYFKEHESGKISEESLKKNISMIKRLGNYSFAEIPKSFEAIIGMSGTLESLSDSEKKVIKEEYGIKLTTYIPSVYGDKKLTFNKNEKIDIVIEKKESYLEKLVQHILNHQSINGPACKRPILIFFEDKERLMELYNSKEYKEFINDTAYLIEEASAEEKTHIVMKATSEGKRLLATRIFGRGTDFVVYDKKVQSNGGVHVIQTFLSEELSEEIQIKGRTARQGDEGSYSMFLLDSSLAKFKITAESLSQNKSRLYDHLNEKRNEYFSKKYSESIKDVQTVKKRHLESMQFLDCLKNRSVKEVKNFILKSGA